MTAWGQNKPISHWLTTSRQDWFCAELSAHISGNLSMVPHPPWYNPILLRWRLLPTHFLQYLCAIWVEKLKHGAPSSHSTVFLTTCLQISLIRHLFSAHLPPLFGPLILCWSCLAGIHVLNAFFSTLRHFVNRGERNVLKTVYTLPFGPKRAQSAQSTQSQWIAGKLWKSCDQILTGQDPV